jgi:hypothetical protein
MAARYQWLTPVILASWEAEIKRIETRGQPGENSLQEQDPISKITRAKWTGRAPALQAQKQTNNNKKRNIPIILATWED